jgi:hypothetical protein
MNPTSEETTVGPALLAPYGSLAFLPLVAKEGQEPDDGKGVETDTRADRVRPVVKRRRINH